MAFEDLKERFQSELKNSWERFQESSVFIQLKEQYENLSPTMQKFVLIGGSALIFFIVFSLPWSYYSGSSDYVAEFENKRQLIRDLLKVSRESQETPNLPVPPDANTLKSQIESQLQGARLTPEQIRPVEIGQESFKILPQSMNQASLNVSLSQLNLRQIIDIGHQIQSISPSVKMIDLQIEANAKDARYFDVLYKLVVLAVPEPVEATPEPEPPPRRRK